MAIRETELDRSGGFEKAVLHDSTGGMTYYTVFVDRLGRVVLPTDTPPTGEVVSINLNNTHARKVVNIETRYTGDRPVAKVVYLEKEQQANV